MIPTTVTPVLPRRLATMSFRGRRLDAHTTLVEVVEEGQTRPLPLHLEVRNHSPSGFEWGYAGSGPAQLALAMCIEMLGPQRAQVVYQQVKDRLVATIQADAWALHAATVANVVRAMDLDEVPIDGGTR